MRDLEIKEFVIDPALGERNRKFLNDLTCEVNQKISDGFLVTREDINRYICERLTGEKTLEVD
jgi:hypothetical protein